ncbi:MAG: fructose-bisphosphatase class III [Kouleothrix sp.]
MSRSSGAIHDISWMGAGGCAALVANVVRLALRYGSLETLLDGYGIHLRALAQLAGTAYADDPCAQFVPKAGPSTEGYSRTLAPVTWAITVIQLKLEAQIIRRHPEYAMEDRLLLDATDLAAGTLALYGRAYPLLDTRWPTLGDGDRAVLTEGEAAAIDSLREQFMHSARLQRHVRFLYSYGNMFQVQDGNLKFHGCLPVDEQGEFIEFALDGDKLAEAGAARALRAAGARGVLQPRCAGACGRPGCNVVPVVRAALAAVRPPAQTGLRERYVLADKATHEEPKGPYYTLRENEDFCRKLLAAFGGDVEHGHIINGHTPVRVKKGERPLLANGKLLVIDGGMSAAYQSVTGIAGYTLIGNSHELVLAAHEPFTSAETMLAQGVDATPHTERIETFPQRVLIAATDTGRALLGQLEDLRTLVEAYRRGALVERPGGTRVG